MNPTVVLRELLTAAFAEAAETSGIAERFAPDVSYWDAVTGPEEGRDLSAAAFVQLVSDFGPGEVQPQFEVRAADDGAAVGELTVGEAVAAITAVCDGGLIVELRCYVDPLDLRSGRGGAVISDGHEDAR